MKVKVKKEKLDLHQSNANLCIYIVELFSECFGYLLRKEDVSKLAIQIEHTTTFCAQMNKNQNAWPVNVLSPLNKSLLNIDDLII